MDTTIVAETPKLGPYRQQMIDTLAPAMEIDPGRIGVKATTNEGVDATGRREAVATYAVCLLQRKPA